MSLTNYPCSLKMIFSYILGYHCWCQHSGGWAILYNSVKKNSKTKGGNTIDAFNTLNMTLYHYRHTPSWNIKKGHVWTIQLIILCHKMALTQNALKRVTGMFLLCNVTLFPLWWGNNICVDIWHSVNMVGIFFLIIFITHW